MPPREASAPSQRKGKRKRAAMGGKRKHQQLSLAWDTQQGELTIIAAPSALRIRLQSNNNKHAPIVSCSNTETMMGEERKTKPLQLQELYLVVDDWDKGYSIHNLHGLQWEYLRDPPLLRLEASDGSRDPRFVSLGSSNILALWQPRSVPTRATVYDTRTGGLLADGPLLPPELHHVRCVAAAAASRSGGRVFALHAGGLHWLEQDAHGYDKEWVWRGTSSPLPLPVDDRPLEITSYAVHPDGHTLFVSARARRVSAVGRTATFSLDTSASGGGGEWRRHGEWLLPFFGQGHYDSTLDAWVGFHSQGHLCACHVPTAAGSGSEPLQLEWTLIPAKDLFVTDPEENLRWNSLMTLTSMGNAEFCMLEPLTTWGVDLTHHMVVDGEYELRLTRFRLKRDRRGQLRLSSRRLVRCYDLCKYDPTFAPRAFLI